MHRNCCVQTENEHDPVFVRVLFILFVFFSFLVLRLFFCYFLNSLLCKLWIRYHSFAQHAFCCCFDHFEKIPKWWIGFFLFSFSISLFIFLSNRIYKCVILCESTALVVSLLESFCNKIWFVPILHTKKNYQKSRAQEIRTTHEREQNKRR